MAFAAYASRFSPQKLNAELHVSFLHVLGSKEVAKPQCFSGENLWQIPTVNSLPRKTNNEIQS